jgi:hypothetical protein
MSRSKKIFALLSIVFLAALFYASYDISRRTTFPGSKPQLKERIKKQFLDGDSAKKDTVKAVRR